MGNALEILERHTVHLMFLDIMMPRMDTFSAIMKIRERQNIPILVMSAKSEESDKILGLSIGADDYITKPFQYKEVLARFLPSGTNHCINCIFMHIFICFMHLCALFNYKYEFYFAFYALLILAFLQKMVYS